MYMEMADIYCIRPLGNVYCSGMAAGGQAGYPQTALDMFTWANGLNYLAHLQTSIS